MSDNLICPICNREMTIEIEAHHLIPKTFKGTETVDIHKICHSKIHKTFSERELKNHYHTIDNIIEHPEMQKFVSWISKKAPEYYDKIKDTNTRKRKRRR